VTEAARHAACITSAPLCLAIGRRANADQLQLGISVTRPAKRPLIPR
jgi:hypothetical protein